MYRYRVTIEEVTKTAESETEQVQKIYEQTVQTLDLPAIMAAVNKKKYIRKTAKEKEQ